jgi:hypothetical protein
VVAGSSAQAQSKTYPKTRRLLLKAERAHANDAFKKLFREGDTRREDLIHALYDSDENVSLNAQTVLKYLADEQSLAAVEEWYAFRRQRGENYWESPITLVSDVKYLGREGSNPEKLVLENLYSNYKDTPVSVTIIAYNKRLETALIEVIIGQIFTSGEHVVVREENGKWRLISKTHIWDS